MSQDAPRLPAGLAAGFTMRNGNASEFAEGIFRVAGSRAGLGGRGPFSMEPSSVIVLRSVPFSLKLIYLRWIVCDIKMFKTRCSRSN